MTVNMLDRGVSRRRFLRALAALGAGATGASVLAGCGASGAPEGSEVEPGEAIAAKSDVENNSAVSYTNAQTGEPEVLMRLPDGEFIAYSAICTHQGCTVSYRPQSHELVCPCHGGAYDPAQGARVVAGPLPGGADRVQRGRDLQGLGRSVAGCWTPGDPPTDESRGSSR